MSQNARLTCRKTPSGVITTKPTEVPSKAARMRSKSMRVSRARVLIGFLAQLHRLAHGGLCERAPQRAREARADALRELVEEVLARREVDDALGFDDLARDVVEAAERIGEPQLDAALAGPDEPGEGLRRLLEARSPALAHDLDELLLDLADHLLRVLAVLGVLGQERVEEILVLARGVDAPLDSQLVDGAGEAEAAHDHADRAHEARLVDVDLVGGDRNVVAARGAQVLDHGVEGRRGILGAQAPDLVVDVARLDGTAAGAVDPEHHPLRAAVLEGAVERLVDLLRRGLRLGRDDPLEVDQRGVLAGGDREPVLLRPADPAEPHRENEEDEREPEELEERVPLARSALLVEGLERYFLENVAFPAGRDGIRHGESDVLFGAGAASSLARTTWPFVSRTSTGSGQAPRHGPATQNPVRGSKIAPCVEQTKYSPLSSKNSPGCQSSSVPRWGQRLTNARTTPPWRTAKHCCARPS